MSLATLDDLDGRAKSTIDDEDRAQFLLDDVSASVQLHTGQMFVRADYELRTRVKRGYVRLPQRPVHSVDTVTDRFDVAVSYTWDGLDRVYIDSLCRVGYPPIQVVDITYDAGPDEVPAAIVGLICSITLRALGVDPSSTGMSQESVDGYAFTIGSVGGSGAYGILPDEARILARFSRQIGSIQVAQ